MNRRVAKIAAMTAVAGVAIALASCSSTSSAPAAHGLTHLTFSMNFTPSGAQAGFTYAQQLGYYKQAGLDVTIEPGTGSIPTAQAVASGKVDIGYTDAPSAFSVAANGGDIKIVSPVLQNNGFALIALKSAGIDSVADIAGKSLALQPSTGSAALMQAVMAKNGVPASSVKIVNVAPSALQATLLSNRASAIVGGGDTQVPQLLLAGKDLSYFMFYKSGVATVGLSITSSSKYLAKHPDIVKKFTDASLRGWAAAKKDPKAAAQSMVTQFPTAGNVDQVEAMLKVDLSLLCSADGATHMGPVSDAVWKQTDTILKQTKMLPEDTDTTSYIAQKYAGSTFPSC